MRHGRAGAQHLRSADDHAVISFLHDVHEDVADFMRGAAAVDGRIDEAVIQKEALRRVARVPSPRALIEGRVKLGLRCQAAHERRLVVRRAAHVAVAHARPCDDRVARFPQLLRRITRLEKFVRAHAGPVDSRQSVARPRIVEGVIQARDGPASVAKRGMLRDVLDALAVDVNFARVPKACQIPCAVEHRVLRIPRFLRGAAARVFAMTCFLLDSRPSRCPCCKTEWVFGTYTQ